jgi:plasmid stabilization system protein ParE
LRASFDVRRIQDYIDQFSPAAAERVGKALVEAGNSLATFPERGRPRRDGLRELVAARSYIIIYRYASNGVEVVTVRHGARRPV